MSAPPRSPGQRRRDTLRRLEQDVDAWVATADPASGTPHLVPLSFLWDGAALLVATASESTTARNLRATGRVRVGIGPTRDVVLVEGSVDPVEVADLPREEAEAFATKAGFDPRELATPYQYFRIRPQRLQAWREADELEGRDLLREGQWLLADDDGGGAPQGEWPLAYEVHPLGWVRSPLTDRSAAPKQVDEGAPPATIVFRPELAEAMADLRTGDDVLVLTWLHESQRDVLSVHPRGDTARARRGVFSTRSPERPNPIGLHRVTIPGLEQHSMTVRGLEAVDGTPVLDVKSVLGPIDER